MNVRIAAALLCLAGAGQARADDWRVVTGSREVMSAIDASTIQVEGSKRVFWAVWLFRTTQSDGVDYVMDHTAIDCEQRTVEIRVEITYSADQNPISQSGDISGIVQPIPPSSSGQAQYEGVCSGRWPSAPSFGSVPAFITAGRSAMERTPVQ